MQKRIDVDSKVDNMIVENKDNYKSFTAVSVQMSLHKCIKELKVKKATVILKVKFYSLEQEKMQDYLVVNALMLEIISLKNIFTIEWGQIYPNLLKYNSKSMYYFKAYKRAVKYILDVQLFIYDTQQELCRYAGRFLIKTPAK